MARSAAPMLARRWRTLALARVPLQGVKSIGEAPLIYDPTA